MRKVNVYKFSEKMPDEGVKIAIIPNDVDAEECVYIGQLVDNLKIWQGWFEEATDEEYKQVLQADIKEMQETGRHLMIEWDDDAGDTHIEDIMDWEWIEV